MTKSLIKLEEETLARHFILTPTGLEVDGEPSFELWEQAGTRLRQVQRLVHWWLGDWLNYGERRWGEYYAQALEETDFTYGRLANIKWVASKVPSSLRSETLSFAHHQEVAPLEPEEQDFFLRKAEREGWSQRELNQAVKAGRGEFENASPAWTPDPARARLEEWADRMARLGWRIAFCGDCGGPGLEREGEFRCYGCGGVTEINESH